jgi:hypothetical protein
MCMSQSNYFVPTKKNLKKIKIDRLLYKEFWEFFLGEIIVFSSCKFH